MSEADQNVYRREKIGFIFQSFNLISNLTAVENVLIPFLPRGVTAQQRADAAELLTRVGLGDRLDHRPYQLSGGEQQRVAIARALVKTAAPGPGRRADRRTRLQDRRRDLPDPPLRCRRSYQTTLVVVTHDRRFITPDDLVLEIQDGQARRRPQRQGPFVRLPARPAPPRSKPENDLAEALVRRHPRVSVADVVEREHRSTTGFTTPRSSQGTT